jgi:catechol 2,3-dioxygenase-like lactoylglutathione lyase family enzyme
VVGQRSGVLGPGQEAAAPVEVRPPVPGAVDGDQTDAKGASDVLVDPQPGAGDSMEKEEGSALEVPPLRVSQGPPIGQSELPFGTDAARRPDLLRGGQAPPAILQVDLATGWVLNRIVEAHPGPPKEGTPMLGDNDAATMIPAKDLEKTRRWYEDVLGFTPVIDDPNGITYKSGSGTFNLYPTQFAGTAQHTLIGWLVPNVEATVDELTAKGITFEHYDMEGLEMDAKGIAHMGEEEKAAWFKDPEGNILSIWQTAR